jgi:hypothetical protein
MDKNHWTEVRIRVGGPLHHSRLRRLHGHDRKEGWLSNTKGKALLYDKTADMFRDQETILHSLVTFAQLAAIEGATLRAPQGEMDDRADAYALACVAKSKVPAKCLGPRFVSRGITGVSPSPY